MTGWSQALSEARTASQHPGTTSETPTFTGNRGLQLEEKLLFEQDAPGRRPQHASQKVDHRRLAGTIRADQRMARAFLDPQRHLIGGDDAAEVLVEADGLKRCRHRHDPLREAALKPPASRPECRPSASTVRRMGSVQRPMRSRPTSTIITSSSPIQNCQYCGVIFAR